MTQLILTILLLLFSWGIWVYVIFNVPYPESLTKGDSFQLLSFFIPLFLALIFSTNIILKNHGIPVMISQTVGDGQVIWSGINLPYHAIRSHNVEEVRFFKNIIEKLLEGAAIEEPTYEAKFINPQKRQIVFHHATGVLFKEQSFPGWGAKIGFGSPSQGLKIYKVGPANPGFMYVRVPTKYAQKETTIAFTYSGSFTTWFLSIISFLIVVFLLEEILIGGRIIGRLRRLAWKRAHGRVKSWWGREDE